MSAQEAPIYPLYMQAVLLPVISFVSLLLSIVPLVLHWKHRNVAASSLICWYMILNVFNIVNAILWPTDDVSAWWDGNGLCDVEGKIMIASYIAVPGTLVCIFRSLACVLDTRRAALVPTRSQRWWNRGMTLLFCFIAPAIAMITQYVYQGGRYFLFAIAGCVNSYDESWVTLVLAYVWPLVICLIAGYYCVIVLYRLSKYRSQFGDIIQSTNSNMNKSRFLRLFLLAFLMLLAIIPVQTYVVTTNITRTLPWHAYSWSHTHPPTWNTIVKVPTMGQVFFDRWIPAASGFMFFIFFGSGRDATKMYCAIMRFVGLHHCFPCLRPSTTTTISTGSTGSTSSRAKLLFHWKWTSASRYPLTSYRTGVNTTTNPRSIPRGFPDIEKGISLQTKNPSNTPWYKRVWRLKGTSSQERTLPLDHLAETTANTVSTTAWAGVSQSRNSSELGSPPLKEDHIRVKQVITQQSELYV
ncbi:pheromone receptor [Aspergillus homomorphus CBS 101889]|uniref:A-pheromone receptor PreA n=1 Tax=Aspergillus homomorphus (strain CBS 101889) TaxID=1450537 RepID=A0A395I3L3_ASPHC|nr:a-pheromone receptor PreA [Aspergillus homomorphus CBS 101889]RAL14203.1 a-pheromone receptor PreA [Aspergillus homomorphus CBS 101889]